MFSRKYLLSAGGLSVTAFLSFWSGEHMFSQSLQGRQDLVKPFVAKISHVSKANTGAVALVRMLTYARRSDRSFFWQMEGASPGEAGHRGPLANIYDVPTHHIIVLDPLTKSAITYMYSSETFMRMLNSMESENCSQPQQDAAEENAEDRFGHATKHRRRGNLIAPGHTINEESWTVPDLNCFAVKEIARRNDGAEIDDEVISLIEGEPPSDMFTIPSGYQERSPGRCLFQSSQTLKFLSPGAPSTKQISNFWPPGYSRTSTFRMCLDRKREFGREDVSILA